MTGFFLAWAAGESIIFYRWAKLKAPPTPGVLALSTGLYIGLSVIGDVYKPARPVVTAFAWAVNLGILLQVVGKAPTGTTGWPPALIDDPTVILPPGAAGGGGTGASAAAGAAGSGTDKLGESTGQVPAPGLPGIFEAPA